jgi:hypothetical protein
MIKQVKYAASVTMNNKISSSNLSYKKQQKGAFSLLTCHNRSENMSGENDALF